MTTWCNDKLNYSRGELSPVECIMLTNINYKASFIKVKVQKLNNRKTKTKEERNTKILRPLTRKKKKKRTQETQLI